MHLGRFHAVIDHIERHFRTNTIAEKLTAAAAALDQFTQNRTDSNNAAFRTKLAEAFDSSETISPILQQPYAQQVIRELHLEALFPPAPRQALNLITVNNGFDSTALSAAIKEQAKTYATQIAHLKQLDASLRSLSVEYTEVTDERAEFGILLPREIVGERLPDLSKEFDKLSNLARAINELTGEPDYDPKVVTISSSWWQVFLDVPAEQIVLWAVAIERIVALFKSNLEIKNLQKQLENRDIPASILKAISEEVNKKISTELKKIAFDLVERFGKIQDTGRKNEVEIQLRQGLIYLAKRMNEGAQVELNVGIPAEPEDPEVKEGVEPDVDLIEANARIRDRIAHLRVLRASAMNASEKSLQIDHSVPLLLEEVRTSTVDKSDA